LIYDFTVSSTHFLDDWSEGEVWSSSSSNLSRCRCSLVCLCAWILSVLLSIGIDQLLVTSCCQISLWAKPVCVCARPWSLVLMFYFDLDPRLKLILIHVSRARVALALSEVFLNHENDMEHFSPLLSRQRTKNEGQRSLPATYVHKLITGTTGRGCLMGVY
jgi:hypothetical protein